jgi:hypothetical protein
MNNNARNYQRGPGGYSTQYNIVEPARRRPDTWDENASLEQQILRLNDNRRQQLKQAVRMAFEKLDTRDDGIASSMQQCDNLIDSVTNWPNLLAYHPDPGNLEFDSALSHWQTECGAKLISIQITAELKPTEANSAAIVSWADRSHEIHPS